VRRHLLLRGAGALALEPLALRGRVEAAYVEPNIELSPLARQRGIITPIANFFVRDHAGVPTIDPARHRLIVHGLVRSPSRLPIS